MRRRFLYCYDISNPKRLRKVNKIASGFGDRVQLSVYECQLTEKEQVHLDERLRTEMSSREDRLLIVDLGPVKSTEPPRFRTMGVPWVPRDREIIVI